MKQAQLFSMMAIFMSALFIIMFSGLTHVALNKDVEIIETEIARFGTLAESLDYFVHKSLDTSGYLFLYSSVEKLQDDCAPNPNSGCYFTDFMQTFDDCLAQGKSGAWDCSAVGQPSNISYKAQLDTLATQLEARYSDLIINVSNTTVGVTQTGPYTFELTGEVQLILTRPGYSWNRFFNVTREISIMGMKDPALAAYGLNHTIQVHITEGPLMTVASLSGYSDYNKATVVNNSYYIRDNRSGLSITEMFQGEKLITPHNDSHPFGITCILPLSLVEDASGTLENRSIISLYEHQFLANFLFVGAQTLYRFDKLNYYGVDDDIIVDSGLFARLGIENHLAVGTVCCEDEQIYAGDGACRDTCG